MTTARQWTIRVCPHGYRVQLFHGHWLHMDSDARNCYADSDTHEILDVVPADEFTKIKRDRDMLAGVVGGAIKILKDTGQKSAASFAQGILDAHGK